MEDRRLVSPHEIDERPLRWLWADRIPQGALTALDGDPGSGKSVISYDIAARLTTGRPMPNCNAATAEPAGVILLQAEDLARQVVLPALRAAGADLAKIRLLDQRRFVEQPLILPDDLSLIEQAVDDGQGKLIVIDPLAAFIRGSANNDSGVRKALGGLVVLAERRDLAILVVRHLRKAGTRNPLHGGAGSIGIIGTVRSGLVVGNDPSSDEKHRHVLAQSKGNLAAAAALAYQTVKGPDGAITVEWLGVSNYTAADLGTGTPDEQTALAEAQYVLYSILAEGPVATNDVIRLSRRAGVSERTLKRAKRDLGVRSWKEGSGIGSRWLWELPQDPKRLRSLHDKDLNDLMDRLLHGSATPALPGGNTQGDTDHLGGDAGDEDGVAG